MVIWVVKTFLHSSSVYTCHLLISSASVRSIPFLSFIEPIFAWNVPLVSLIFLEEISSLSHSVVFLCFFALLTEEHFLISPCYSLELCIQMENNHSRLLFKEGSGVQKHLYLCTFRWEVFIFGMVLIFRLQRCGCIIWLSSPIPLTIWEANWSHLPSVIS